MTKLFGLGKTWGLGWQKVLSLFDVDNYWVRDSNSSVGIGAVESGMMASNSMGLIKSSARSTSKIFIIHLLLRSGVMLYSETPTNLPNALIESSGCSSLWLEILSQALIKASQWLPVDLLFLLLVLCRFPGIGELELVLSETADSWIQFSFMLDRA